MILHDLISYDVLRIIWWLLLGIVLVGFAVMDGFDLGTGMLLPFVGKTDLERRIVINTVGPVWEGNQVWLILAGGGIFAAWPQLYAVSFSGFYIAMFLVLVGIILRPVGFKYRSKRESKTWRSTWDWLLFIGGFLPSLIFGVAMGNVLEGVPFEIKPDMQIFYRGSFFGLLNPFAILCGVLSIVMLLTHGASWLAVKTDDPIFSRVRKVGMITGVLTTILYGLCGLLLNVATTGYHITGGVVANGPSNPLMKQIATNASGWLENYHQTPMLWIVPIIGLVAPLLAAACLAMRKPVLAIIANGLGIAGIIASVGVAMFPFILPSIIDPVMSLTVWDSSSSHFTLFVMLIVAIIFVPTVLAYTSWVYKILWGKVSVKTIEGNKQSY
ncbi:Cytochrome ubiquinol oxidase subunit 2 [Bartonella apihabitans]|uniref:cytochrome d ubiquinol oxidase subunit II n=1 Tax=Bartonella apihabitans TaxID=2750929 RepID=UPI003997A956